MIKNHRQAIVVLGMHRSGTSAVAGIAARLGAAAPRTPLPPSADNPSGFYESLPIVNRNYMLLRTQNCYWNVCLGFDVSRAVANLSQADIAAFTDILHTEFGDAACFVLKDPRLCLLLPVWLPALERIGADLRTVVVVRHPAEVISSLAARNGLDALESGLHWLHHMLEAERLSRGHDRAVVLYADLLTDWRTSIARITRHAGIAWPAGAADAAIDAFVKPPSRHHATNEDPCLTMPEPIAGMIGLTWLALRRLSDEPGDPAATAYLDRIGEKFMEFRRENLRIRVQAPMLAR